ncbi:MAG: biotin--[acetyl-CoA-carboxylase] ligase [Polyangiaceae bacterium]|nr:biotin--[acetyl-CoA-carboxylase] ligase [Polyangiaceae bacterium]
MTSSGHLDETRIMRALRERRPAYAGGIRVHASTGSTSDDAKRLAREGCAHGTLVVAEEQTAGRGRSGSAWYSPRGENVYASVALLAGEGAFAGPSFALVVGLPIARAVDRAIGTENVARIKWPNDVHVRGRKVSGVLVEALSRGTRASAVIVGVGINVATTSFPPELDAIATSLAREGAKTVDRSELVVELAAGILDAWDSYQRAGLAPFLPELRARDALLGRRVRIDGVEGVASAILDDGRLSVVDDAGTMTAVVAGHVEILADVHR